MEGVAGTRSAAMFSDGLFLAADSRLPDSNVLEQVISSKSGGGGSGGSLNMQRARIAFICRYKPERLSLISAPPLVQCAYFRTDLQRLCVMSPTPTPNTTPSAPGASANDASDVRQIPQPNLLAGPPHLCSVGVE